MTINHHIAENLRRQRKLKRWSLDRTATATGVSKAMLGQIERLESSPTIATLWKIATGLECSFSSFLSSQSIDQARQNEKFDNDPNMLVKTLSPYTPDTQIEVFEITLCNLHEQISMAHQIGVKETIYVIAGSLSIFVNGSWEPLAKGEAKSFLADIEHGYRDETGKTVFTTTVHYPSCG